MDGNISLNSRSRQIFQECLTAQCDLRIQQTTHDRVTVADFGVNVPGGLAAGLQLARICMGGLGQVNLNAPGSEIRVPRVVVSTDHPLKACLHSQYAGWKVATDDYFAMASGPMRAINGTEDLFSEFPADEQSTHAVGVLEAGKLPTDSAIGAIKAGLPDNADVMLAVAPTASQAGNIQVVARSVETAMHKLHELKFPVDAIVSGAGTAPLPPVAGSDLEGIGRTNDAILYGATVNLWVDCDDDVIAELGPQTPSNSSPAHGQRFQELFEAANYDFYALDKNLFSPAVVIFHNISSGRSFVFGVSVASLLHESFGL